VNKPFKISFANHAVEQSSGSLVPCLIVVSPVMPARAQIIIGGQVKDLSIIKRPNSYYAISSILWSDAEIQLQIDAIEVVVGKHIDCVTCWFYADCEFIVAIQHKQQSSASTPVKQHHMHLSLGDVVGVQQVP
jgi:hypothetical protein